MEVFISTVILFGWLILTFYFLVSILIFSQSSGPASYLYSFIFFSFIWYTSQIFFSLLIIGTSCLKGCFLLCCDHIFLLLLFQCLNRTFLCFLFGIILLIFFYSYRYLCYYLSYRNKKKRQKLNAIVYFYTTTLLLFYNS